jgi:hypothetical protein
MATGLPVATYRPIPGHGMRSAATLAQAGVSTWIRQPRALGPTLARLMDGDLGERQRSAAAPMLRADPAEVVARLARPSRNNHVRHDGYVRSWGSPRDWRSIHVDHPRVAIAEEGRQS